jgi:hypothetical protein
MSENPPYLFYTLLLNMIAEVSLKIKICSIFYAQDLEQSLTDNAAKTRRYSQYDIVITELWLNENQSQHPFITVHLTISNISALVWLVECVRREHAIHFTACVVANSSTDVNTTVMSWCILPKKTCNLVSLDENVGLHSAFIPRRAFKFRVYLPLT